MKHKLTVVLCILVLLAVSFGALVGYHQYRIKRASAEQAVQQQLDQQRSAEAAKQKATKDTIGKLVKQCKQDQTAYNALTAKQKQTTPAPDCGNLQLVE